MKPVTSLLRTSWEAFKQGQPGLGGVTFDTEALASDTPDARQLLLNIDRFSKVCMAGIAAETQIYGSAEGGTEDRQKLKEFLAAVGRPASECQLRERLAIRQAQTLIQENWESYEALILAMEQRASVAECCQVIQQHWQASQVAA
jgi:hypothetical protein